MRHLPDFKKPALAAASGLLLTGAFPGWGVSWLAWIALVPLLACLRNLSPGQALRAGFFAGIVHYLTLVYWLAHTMNTYGSLPWMLSLAVLMLLAAYLAGYPAVFCLLLVRAGNRPIISALMVPVLWTALEYIRTLLFSGFPWELLGYTQFDRLHLIQISDIFGVYGLSFLVAMGNAAVFQLILGVGRKRWQGRLIPGATAVLHGLVFCLALGAAWGYGAWRMEQIDRRVDNAKTVQIAVVQGNVDQAIKWDRAFQAETTQKYVTLSLAARDSDPDLVVWPETAAPFYFLVHPQLTKRVRQGIRRTGSDFLIGSPSFERRADGVDYYNSAYLVHADGSVGGRYDKVHLVPFGEYVPLKKWLPFVGKMVEHVGDFKSGQKGSGLAWKDYRLGVQICYEMIFPQLSRAMVKNGADLLFNLTNDAWYGRTSAPYQHFSMAVMRAVENRRSVIRAANTGISGFIGPTGRVAAATAIYEDAVLVHRVPVVDTASLYTRFGDVFALACLALAGLAVGWPLAGCRRRRSEKPET